MTRAKATLIFLRSDLAGGIGIVALTIAALLIWQQLAGWPARRSWTMRQLDPEAVQVFRFPKRLAPSDWNRGLVRVERDGRVLPCFADTDSFRTAAVEGFFVRGKTISIRSAALLPGDASAAWKISAPWNLSASVFAAILAATALFTAILLRARNPLLISFASRLRTGGLRRGMPWPALGLAALALTAALLVRVCGFSFPSWENDSPTYFGSAFHVAAGGSPLATPDRPFGYPLAVGMLLRFIPDFRAIVVLHMVASVVAALALGAVVWMTGPRLFAGSLARLFCQLLGIAGFAAVALNEAILEREWSLLSEAWAAIYLGLQVILIWLLASRRRSLGWNLALFAACCFCGLMTFFTRANWGFALAMLPLPWIVASFLNATSRRTFFVWIFSGAGVFVALVAATFSYQAHCRASQSRPYLYDRARALVCWHVPLIQTEIERRLREQPQDPMQPVLAELAQVLGSAIERAKTEGSGSYPSFSYDPDYLYFKGLTRAPRFRALTVEQRTELCASLFAGGLRHHPEIYLGKVLAQIRIYFRHPYQTPAIYLPVVAHGLARSQQALAMQEIPDRFAASYAPVMERAREEYARPWPSAARWTMSLRETLIFDWLKKAFAWCIAVPLVICALSFGAPRWRAKVAWSSLAPVVAVAIWSFGSSLLSALSSAATQGLDIQRYIELAMPLTFLAQLLFPLLAIGLVGKMVRPNPALDSPGRGAVGGLRDDRIR